MPRSERFESVVERVRRLNASYTPPDFAHVPDPDAALFLCAVDHRTGYERPHSVGGSRAVGGSELMWAVALAAAGRRPGLLTAAALATVSADDVADAVCDRGRDGRRSGSPCRAVARPRGGARARYGGRRPRCWPPPAAARRLRRAARSARRVRGVLRPAGQEGAAVREDLRAPRVVRGRRSRDWEVSADNVLMRLALRSGLVEPGELDEVRAATRAAFKRGRRRDRDLAADARRHALGTGPRRPGPARSRRRRSHEPPRDPDSAWY